MDRGVRGMVDALVSFSQWTTPYWPNHSQLLPRRGKGPRARRSWLSSKRYETTAFRQGEGKAASPLKAMPGMFVVSPKGGARYEAAVALVELQRSHTQLPPQRFPVELQTESPIPLAPVTLMWVMVHQAGSISHRLHKYLSPLQSRPRATLNPSI
jgi:hypothetical protein